MIETVLIGAPGFVIAWWVFIQWRCDRRAEAGRCPRCGTSLGAIESRLVRVRDSVGGRQYRMCVPCARRTSVGWMLWTVVLALLVLSAAAALHLGWLPND